MNSQQHKAEFENYMRELENEGFNRTGTISAHAALADIFKEAGLTPNQASKFLLAMVHMLEASFAKEREEQRTEIERN